MKSSRQRSVALAVLLVSVMAGGPALGADPGARYLNVVHTFADTLLEKGRDVYGPKKTALWAGVINVEDGSVPATAAEVPPSPGVREKDRSVGGCNLHQDVSTIHAFRTLSKLLNDPKYAKAVDAYVRDYFEVAQSPVTGQLAWGEHAYYDLFRDRAAGPAIHELLESTPPWEVLWEVNPAATTREIEALKYHFVSEDPAAGEWLFNRHAALGKAEYEKPIWEGRTRSMAWIKHAGLYAYSYAFLFSKTHDLALRTRAIGIGELYWNHRNPQTNLVQSCLKTPAPETNGIDSQLQNSLMCYYVLKGFNYDPTNTDARDHAMTMLKAIDKYHWDAKARTYRDSMHPDGKPLDKPEPKRNPWAISYGEGLIPRLGRVMAYAARTQQDTTCREAAIRVGEILNTTPLPDNFTAEEVGLGIHLNLDLYELTKDRAYLEKADRLGTLAVDKLLANGLFRRMPGDKYYEAKLGPGDLALSLLRLSLRLDGKPDPAGIHDWSF